MGDPARNLFHVEHGTLHPIERKALFRLPYRLLRTERKPGRRFVAFLAFTPAEIDRPPIEATRRSGLKSTDLKPQLSQTVAHAGGGVPHPAPTLILQTYVQQTPH